MTRPTPKLDPKTLRWVAERFERQAKDDRVAAGIVTSANETRAAWLHRADRHESDARLIRHWATIAERKRRMR